VTAPDPILSLEEDRFTRFRAIEWWDQDRLSRAKMLVIGAGALGNEVLKNLALLGVGHVLVADRDSIELSNLSRSVLFRESDAGAPKAECAARGARAIFPDAEVIPLVGNILTDLGLGWFRWADVVIGALDNREARVFTNAACARVGKPWIDGGIEVFQGVARGFAPPRTACYECTMNRTDWDLLQQGRSCSFLARRAAAQRGTPTTPSIASVIAGIQTMEAVKVLHGMEALLGRGVFFDGLGHNSYTTQYPINPECPWHEDPVPPIEAVGEFSRTTPLRTVAEWAGERLGGLDALDLARELVAELECPSCGKTEPVYCPLDAVQESMALCPVCRADRVPRFLHSLPADSPLLDKSPADLGLPSWDIVWARHNLNMLGIEFAGDAPRPRPENEKPT